MRRICVFCGSSIGAKPVFGEAAAQLGRLLAQHGIGLVYGGASIGLMGMVADAALAAGGEVIGVIPNAMMNKEVAHAGLTKLHVVASMHERKAMMAELSDGFLALPGGIGTMEELFEVWSWGQLGIHAKPLGFLDVAGYYQHLHVFLDNMVEQGFLRPRHREMVAVEADAEMLLKRFAQYEAPPMVQVVERTAT